MTEKVCTDKPTSRLCQRKAHFIRRYRLLHPGFLPIYRYLEVARTQYVCAFPPCAERAKTPKISKILPDITRLPTPYTISHSSKLDPTTHVLSAKPIYVSLSQLRLPHLQWQQSCVNIIPVGDTQNDYKHIRIWEAFAFREPLLRACSIPTQSSHCSPAIFHETHQFKNLIHGFRKQDRYYVAGSSKIPGSGFGSIRFRRMRSKAPTWRGPIARPEINNTWPLMSCSS